MGREDAGGAREKEGSEWKGIGRGVKTGRQVGEGKAKKEEGKKDVGREGDRRRKGRGRE